MSKMKANSHTLPPFPVKTGPGRTPKRSGPVPAWGLKVGSLLTTLLVFGSSLGFAKTNLYVTNAPLQPATVAVAETAATATPTSSTTSVATTTLSSTVRTTTRAAVTSTKSS